jgi:hypothetical protein
MSSIRKIDVQRRARRSVQAVGEVHLTLRNLSREQVVRARSAIELTIRGYKEAGAESVIGLGTRCVGDTTADIARLIDWDDVRLRLVNKNSSLPRLWPRPSHREAKAEEIIALREAMEQGRAKPKPQRLCSLPKIAGETTKMVCRCRKAYFLLYKLQVGRHPTHTLQ